MPSTGNPEAGGAAGLLLAVMQLLQAQSNPEARRIIDINPELLTEEAERLLDMGSRRFVRNRDDPSAASSLAVIEERRELLRRCREVGVDRAFAEHGRMDPEHLVALLTRFAKAQTSPEAGSIVRQYPEIMGHMAQDLMRTFAANAKRAHNYEAAATIEGQRRLLLRCREIGIREAFEEQPSRFE
jgi:hypothetical protein